MLRKVLKSKIHRATITQADLHYEGSITIPEELLEKADILHHEGVSVWNITAGSRFETYAIPGPRKSKAFCINGAAARLVSVGDLVIIASFAYMDEKELSTFEPRVLLMDEKNQVKKVRSHSGSK